MSLNCVALCIYTHVCMFKVKQRKNKDNELKWNVFIYKQWDRISYMSQVYIIMELRIGEMRIRNVGKYD